MTQNRMLAILLGAVAALVLVVGGLSAVLLLSGGGNEGGGSGGAPSGVSTSASGGGGAAASPGVLRLPGADPITLDPALATDAGSALYIVELFSGLVTITPDLQLQLDLAKSYTVSNGGKTFTFVLRSDATFHDGRPVTAQDVAWSIDRVASPTPLGATQPSTTALAYLGDIAGVAERFRGTAPKISGMEVVDDHTIRFTLKQALPEALFLAKLSYPTAFVVDRRQIESNQRNWSRKPNGTGPFKLREWTLGQRIVLDAHTAFYGGAPLLKQVVFDLAGGSQLTRFENGELDIAGVGLSDLPRARDDQSSALHSRYRANTQLSVAYIGFNTSQPPFDDVNVRRAMAMAIDRQKVATETFDNYYLPATGILPPRTPGYTPDDKSLRFDPAQAQAALKASKYGSADKLPPIVLEEVGGGAEAGIDTQAFQQQWKTVLGINVEVKQADFASLLADLNAGKLQMFSSGWIMDYPDPENILDLKFNSKSTLNEGHYANTQVDALLDQARLELDAQKRIALYQQAEKLIVGDVAWIPLYFQQSHQVVGAAVEGWVEPAIVLPRLRFVKVKR